MLGGLGAGGSILRDLASGGFGSFGGKEGAYNYFAILGSRTVLESVVDRFDLINVYDSRDSSMEKAIEELEDNVLFEEQEDEYVTITAFDRDPQRAADISNFFVERLNEISINLGTEEARNNRQFIERQLASTKGLLRASEDSLRAYQEKTGTIIVVDPSGSSSSPIAELYAVKARKEIELAILRRTASSDNALVRQLELELSEIDKKVATYPVLGIESLRLYREVAIQQKILEFLVPLYEQAKVDEQKDVPVLLVLDHAVPAEYKAKPKRALIVVVICFIAFLSLSALILFLNNLYALERKPTEIETLFVRIGDRILATYRMKL